MLIPVEKLLWDSTAFDNNYADIMPLVESIRERGVANPHIEVMPLGDRFLIITGRNTARAIAMLGHKEVQCYVLESHSEMEILMHRIVESQRWKPGYHEGRNYHVYREGY